LNQVERAVFFMDGHARYYLRRFPKMIKAYSAYGPLWYLGGNLSIGDGAGYEREFLEMRFDRVFVKFIGFAKGDSGIHAGEEFGIGQAAECRAVRLQIPASRSFR
jgi:hypothetical protein